MKSDADAKPFEMRGRSFLWHPLI